MNQLSQSSRSSERSPQTGVLFVCLGNICRSPTAEGIFQHLVNIHQLSESIFVDSAGTGSWHIGRPPDARSQRVALQRGYDISHLRARQVSAGDFDDFDYILALDAANLANLEKIRPQHYAGHLGLLLPFAPHLRRREVPDPYGGDEKDFQLVVDLIQEAAEGLLNHIKGRL
ncbi:MAG: low molecular weight protein-tyrosine-phosphatase [Porticoccaceae bacterium]